MYFIKEYTPPPGREARMSTHRLFRYHCRDASLLAKKPLENAIKSQLNTDLIQKLNIR